MDRDFARPGPTEDTIAAVATPDGVGGIAVVRVSGPRALDCVRSIFAGRAFDRGVESHRAYHGYVHDPADDSDLIDEVVVLPMLAPHSYTAEDTVEISCHGGAQPARMIVDACVAAGARPAGPGEFTRRAFLNGRISLDQAEAVADLIHAETRLASAGALAQLGGGLRREIRELEEPLIGLLAELEGGLEFAAEEQAGVEVSRRRVAEIVDGALSRIESLLDLGPAGRRIREGVVVALMGEPNAGKSSLFNALLGRPRALVDAAPGTTRDVVDATMIHRGVRFELHDTAGLRTASSRVESMGIELARDAAASADIVLWLNDLSVDVKDINSAPDELSPLVPDSTVIIPVGTKADLVSADASVAGGGAEDGLPVVTSAVSGRGVDELRNRILAAARADRMEQAAALGIVLNRRHLHRLAAARDELRSLSGLAADGAEDEVLSTMLGSALAGLGEISGRVFTENLLGEIFSRFCVGK